ncbi:MAG: hypothetical protein JXB05_33060 [Myxococcaceae bacterium]|nr:hypothetical protein [Myxococcaceae bacterium]
MTRISDSKSSKPSPSRSQETSSSQRSKSQPSSAPSTGRGTASSVRQKLNQSSFEAARPDRAPVSLGTRGNASVAKAFAKGGQTPAERGEEILSTGREFAASLQNPDGSFTNTYREQCLHFVTDVLAEAGSSDPLLAQPTAAEAMAAVDEAGLLNECPDSGNPMEGVPEGAVVFWPDPKPEGHVAIFAGMNEKGQPTYLTAPVGPMEGPGERTITSLLREAVNGEWTPTPPAGWYMPGGQ